MHILDFRQLVEQGKLEAGSSAGDDSDFAILSLAISAKRISDALDELVRGDGRLTIRID